MEVLKIFMKQDFMFVKLKENNINNFYIFKNKKFNLIKWTCYKNWSFEILDINFKNKELMDLVKEEKRWIREQRDIIAENSESIY